MINNRIRIFLILLFTFESLGDGCIVNVNTGTDSVYKNQNQDN